MARHAGAVRCHTIAAWLSHGVLRFDGSAAIGTWEFSSSVTDWRGGDGVSNAKLPVLVANRGIPGRNDGIVFPADSPGHRRLARERGNLLARSAFERFEFLCDDHRVAHERNDPAANAHNRVGLVRERRSELADF